MGLNREFLGRRFGPATHRVTEKEIRNYADVVRSKGADFGEGSVVAPPVFSVIYELPLLEAAWKDPGLHGGTENAEKNVLMLVHGSQDMRFHRPVRPGDGISFTAEITAIEDKGSGELLRFSVKGTDESSGPVVSSDWGLFIRGIGSGKKPAKRGKPRSRGAEKQPPPLFRKVVSLEGDITRRYADVSNDRNPIHLDESVAKKAGFPGIIVHGLCTMAICADSIIECCLDGRPERLKRLALRFARPVYPEDSLFINGFRAESGTVGFDVERAGDGEKVVKGGLAEVSA